MKDAGAPAELTLLADCRPLRRLCIRAACTRTEWSHSSLSRVQQRRLCLDLQNPKLGGATALAAPARCCFCLAG